MLGRVVPAQLRLPAVPAPTYPLLAHLVARCSQQQPLPASSNARGAALGRPRPVGQRPPRQPTLEQLRDLDEIYHVAHQAREPICRHGGSRIAPLSRPGLSPPSRDLWRLRAVSRHRRDSRAAPLHECDGGAVFRDRFPELVRLAERGRRERRRRFLRAEVVACACSADVSHI